MTDENPAPDAEDVTKKAGTKDPQGRNNRPPKGPVIGASVDGQDVFRLEALLTLDDAEFDLLAVPQGAVAIATNGTEVDKHVFTSLALNETETLGIVEPLHGALLTLRYNQPQKTLYRIPMTHNPLRAQMIEHGVL